MVPIGAPAPSSAASSGDLRGASSSGAGGQSKLLPPGLSRRSAVPSFPTRRPLKRTNYCASGRPLGVGEPEPVNTGSLYMLMPFLTGFSTSQVVHIF